MIVSIILCILANFRRISDNQTMQLMLKAIIPRLDEVIGYFVFGVIAITLMNIMGLRDALFAISQTDFDVQKYIDSSILGYIGQLTEPLNGRLGNSFIWAIIGVIAFAFGLIVSSEVKDLLEYRRLAKIITTKSHSDVWLEFFVRTFIRLSALSGLIFWIYFLVIWYWQFVSRIFLECLFANPMYLWGLLGLVAGGILLGLYLYIAAVLCRLVTLRVRVFSDELV